MASQVKTFATKPHNLSLNLGNDTLNEENQFL